MSRFFWGCFRLFIALTFMAGGKQILAADSSKTNSSKTIQVFLLAGQSNMEGADAHANRIDDYPVFKGAGAPQSDVLFASLPTEDSREPALWRTLTPGESFGPEITFARKLKRSGVAPIAIIKSAIGGTTVAFDWNPAAPTNGQILYPRTLKLVRESLQELDRRGVRYQLEGVLWHQGENDTYFTPYRRHYAVWMQRCISQVRQDFKSPNLPWFISEQHPAAIWKNSDEINRSLRAMAQSETGVTMITTSQLPHERTHFGTKGTLLLGDEFAKAYLRQLRVNRP